MLVLELEFNVDSDTRLGIHEVGVFIFSRVELHFIVEVDAHFRVVSFKVEKLHDASFSV